MRAIRPPASWMISAPAAMSHGLRPNSKNPSKRPHATYARSSAALDLAYVACGRFDGFFEFGLKPWDIAAGALIVQEAGGRIARIDGEPLDLEIGDILGAAPGIYDAVRAETAEFLREIRWQPTKRR